MRLLYVDDDRINTLVFTETCRLVPGLEVAAAATGVEAEELCAQFRPGLLVIDLHLPDTDGCELLPRLRAACGDPALTAFLCTAEDERDVRDLAARAGFAGCWTKPVDIDALVAQLSALQARADAQVRPAEAR